MFYRKITIKVVQLAEMRSKRSPSKILCPLCFTFKHNHSLVFDPLESEFRVKILVKKWSGTVFQFNCRSSRSLGIHEEGCAILVKVGIQMVQLVRVAQVVKW